MIEVFAIYMYGTRRVVTDIRMVSSKEGRPRGLGRRVEYRVPGVAENLDD